MVGVIDDEVLRSGGIVGGHRGGGHQGAVEGVGQCLARVDALAAAGGDDVVEGASGSFLLQGIDACCGDLPIEGEELNFDAHFGAGGLQAITDDPADKAVDHH
ncbi:hypothetical protein D9M68_828620 [compost metagenome]